ncbi:hypothetical protein ACWGVR_11840, partial [Streptomyces xanthophaeus]
MQSRRALSLPLKLSLAVFVLATGCVTVRPAAPPSAPGPVPAATRTAPPHARPQPQPPAWPLGTLPAVPAPVPAAGAEGSAGAPETARAVVEAARPAPA